MNTNTIFIDQTRKKDILKGRQSHQQGGLMSNFSFRGKPYRLKQGDTITVTSHLYRKRKRGEREHFFFDHPREEVVKEIVIKTRGGKKVVHDLGRWIIERDVTFPECLFLISEVASANLEDADRGDGGPFGQKLEKGVYSITRRYVVQGKYYYPWT